MRCFGRHCFWTSDPQRSQVTLTCVSREERRETLEVSEGFGDREDKDKAHLAAVGVPLSISDALLAAVVASLLGFALVRLAVFRILSPALLGFAVLAVSSPTLLALGILVVPNLRLGVMVSAKDGGLAGGRLLVGDGLVDSSAPELGKEFLDESVAVLTAFEPDL